MHAKGFRGNMSDTTAGESGGVAPAGGAGGPGVGPGMTRLVDALGVAKRGDLGLAFGVIFILVVLILPMPCLLYTSPSPRDRQKSRMPSSA